jgi:mannose/fructose/N-acetylgalactosamine-specific phosphotransferase system component IIC
MRVYTHSAAALGCGKVGGMQKPNLATRAGLSAVLPWSAMDALAHAADR